MCSYPGGKSGAGVYQSVINQFPPHRVYVEGFLGGGSIMRLKLPAEVNIGIDSDAVACSSFQMDGVTVLNRDVIPWLEHRHFEEDVLIYLDPPYLLSTRKCKERLYRHELGASKHRRLLNVITSLDCMVAISGYMSQMYSSALSSWRLVQFNAVTRGGSVATECLWCNYPSPSSLHDPRFIGSDFRDRERIRKLVSRWSSRFSALSLVDRMAVRAALDVVSGDEIHG